MYVLHGLMTRTCTKCEKEKPVEEFSFRNKKKGTRRYRCKLCLKQYNKQHYEDNKKVYIDRARNRNSEVSTQNKIKILDYLSSHPCVDCGESDPVVLEFDHINRSEKHIEVASMRSYSWESVEKEIHKCVVRCANCHRRRTAKQLGWYRAFG